MDLKSFLKISCIALSISLSGYSAKKNQYIPEANAGPDKFTNVNQTVKLNASDSTDIDGNRLSYLWKIISKPDGSQANIIHPNQVTSSIEVDQPGTYEIELMVSDGSESSATDTILIDTQDTKPQLSVINDQKVLVGETAFIDGSNINDPDGDELLFDWQLERKPLESNAVVEDASSSTPTVLTDILGKYSVKLKVSDGKSNVDSGLINIFAIDFFDQSNRTLGCVLDRIFFDGFEGLFSNSPPVADVGSDKMGVIGQVIALDGSLSSDIDLDNLTYSWSLLTSPNGSAVTIDDNDQMVASLSPDVTGDYVAQLIVSDGCLDSDPDSALVTISVNQAPQITSSPDTSIRESQAYSYQVSATDPEDHDLSYELTVSPAGLTIDGNGLITWTSLGEGSYPVTVTVTDEYGASDSQSYDLAVVANSAPIIQSFPLSSAEQDFDYSYQLVVNDADDDSITYQLVNPVAGMTVDTNGLITWTPDAAGSYQVEVQVDDGFGGTDTQTFTLEVIQLPPNPVDIAPALSQTSFPPFIETINFLYDSLPPVQVGMPDGTIEDYRAAVLKGRTLNADGNPLAGVKVAINNHPEYGYTYSRQDGQYDLVVNGGGTQTINFEKGGYLKLQRDIKTSWEDFAYSEDVVLIRLDDKLTKVDLSDISLDFQIVEGNLVTDEDGIRKATLLFPSGVNANIHLADGSVQPIVNMNVRATEFTVGNLGKKRMPGNLPPASGYTYAVELSIDEALFLDAEQVSFDQAVPFYVENFLNFPTGVNVPLASYERNSAYWIPEKSGRVIKILRIENDAAVIDVTNDEIDNDASQIELDAIGITNAELSQLALLYDENQSLWRSTVSHFTPYDCNWPYVPPETVMVPPEQPGASAPPEDTNDDSPYDEAEKLDLNTDCTGCNINAQNRTLEEEIPVIGTNEKLYYRSSQVYQDAGFDEYVIPLTGATISPDLKRVVLRIEGETFEYEPATNLSYTFIWDGTEHYDRSYHSKKTGYSIDHVYDAVYAPTPEEFERAFDVYIESGISFAGSGSRELLEIKATVSNEIRLYRKFEPQIPSNLKNKMNGSGIGDVRSEQSMMGSWNIKSHHVYNPYQRILFMGDGFKRQVVAFKAGIENPNVSNHPGPTDVSQIGESSAVAVNSIGEVYFSDEEKGHIVKIDLNGNAVRVAGRIHETPFPICNEEPIELESALDVCLTDVEDIEIAPNGDVYYVFERRVRKIDRNGLVTTVAGSGSFGGSPDGTPALDAALPARNIAFDKHNTLYISVGWGIRIVDENGNIQTIAGGGFFQPFEDPVFENIPAVDTEMFGASGFDINNSGSIVIADTKHRCTRQITPDGWIYTINGSQACYAEPDDEKAVNGGFSSPKDVKFNSDNSLVILDTTSNLQLPVVNKIIKVHPFGMVETLVDSVPGYSGDNGLLIDSQINLATDLAIDASNKLYIADTYNERIRKINLNGIISTIAGGLPVLVPPAVAQQIKKSASTPAKGQKSGLESDSFVVVSLDGKLIYEFTDEGVHTKTIDSTTGRVYKQFFYDAQGRLASIKDENSLMTQIERVGGANVSAIVSPYGKRTELAYFPGGLLKKVTDPNLNHWDLEYNNNKQLSAFTDRNNHRHQYSYMPNGLLLSDLNPIGGGWQLSAPNDVGGSNQVTMTSAEGREYAFFNDNYRTGLGEYFLYENTMPDGTVKSHTEAIHTSNRDITITPNGTTITNGDSTGSRFGYQYHWDNDIEVITPSGLRNHTWNDFANDYDGNPPAVIAPVPEYTRTSLVHGQPWVVEYKQSFGTDGGYRNITPELRTNISLLNDDKKLKSYGLSEFNDYNVEYDGSGRINRMYTGTGLDIRETLFTYYNSGLMNGELHTITNPLGHTSSFEYDNNGRITKKIFPDLREVTFTYDANGNLASLTPPGRLSHTFSYNGLDNNIGYFPPTVAGVTSPGTLTEYNLDQQMTKVIRPDGREINLTYNSATGKIESKTIAFGSFNYIHDALTSQLKTITSPDAITINYAYDGFLPISTTWSGDISGKVSRTYDNLFRVSGRMINDTDEILYTYDNDNLLINAGSLTINREVQKGGLVSSTTLDDVETTYTYTGFAELDFVDNTYNANSIYSNNYSTDKLGRISLNIETLDSLAVEYGYEYDLSGRLEEVTINGLVDKTWSYDLNNNRTHEDGFVIASYDNQDRLLTYKGATFTYNANGDLETKTQNTDITSYSFDEEGLLRSITLPDSTNIEYLLDGLGRRVGKKVNGSIVAGWLYLDGLKPIAELNSSGMVTARYVYGAKTNVPSYMIKNGTTYRILSNHLGSPKKIVDVDTGTIIQELSYDAWGNVISDTNPGFQPFGFAGGHYDLDTKLTRFGMREYDAEIGRWLSKDPTIFNGKDSNLYTYSFNDPVNFRDEDGEIAQWVIGGLAIGTVQAIATYFATDGDMGSVINGFIGGFIAGALPILKFNKLNPGKALSEVQAELSDAFAGILLDVGLNLVFDTDAFIPNAEAATLEEHTIEGDHEHALHIVICGGDGKCPQPERSSVCISK